MLWIETYQGDLINMSHVVKIAAGHHVASVDTDIEFWLGVQLVNQTTLIPIAKGENPNQCESMKYRIMTYIENQKDYGDRNIIRHKWLTHKLP